MADTIPLQKKPLPILLIVVIILNLLLLSLAFYFYRLSIQEVKLRKGLASKVSGIEQEKNAVAQELAKAKSDLEAVQKRMDEVAKELETAKAAKSSAEESLNAKNDEISKTQKEYQKRISELEKDVKRYADFSAALTMELKPIKDALAIQGLSNIGITKPDLGVGSVSAQTVGGGTQSAKQVDLIAGKVVSINKEFGFVLINIGSKNGATLEHFVQVYQGDNIAGIGRIEKSQPDISIVSLASEDLMNRIHVGDKVVLT